MTFLKGLCITLLVCGSLSAAEPTRVMSFNLRYGTAPDGENSWPLRREQVADVILGFGPDLLGTQEMLAFQRDELLGLLDGYRCLGVGRDNGVEKGEMAAVFFRTARYDAVDSGTLWLCDTPDVPGTLSWDATFPRTFCWALLKDKRDDGQPVLMVCTHWDHQSENARRRSGAMIGEWVHDQDMSPRVVVVGDFNCGPKSEAIKRMKEAGGLVDPFFTELNKTPELGSFHAFTGNPTTSRIDGVYLSPAWRALSVEVVRTNRDGRYPSDHFPVTAVIEPAGE